QKLDKFLMDLAQVKQVSKSDLKAFLAEDHTSFSVLNVMLKSIQSTGRTSITLSKNSAKSFYLNQPKNQSTAAGQSQPQLPDDCLQDAQNCDFFQFFNRKEKRLYIRFLDKVEANFEGTAAEQPLLFLTLTFNTTQDNLSTFTTNTDPNNPC
ncbi:4320_t:CDS:1, partial [Ambispora gerdemannii]